jgi:hypothetical protein
LFASRPTLKGDDAASPSVLDHECRLDRAGERTLVEVVVENETTVDRRVRVANRLDAPVEPPREGGAPAPGWDEDGWTGVVPADGRLTLGYACASPPAEPAVTVTDEGRPDDETAAATPRDAVRLLGDAAPPAEAVPDAEDPDPDPPAPVAAMTERLDEDASTAGDAPAADAEASDGASADPGVPDDSPTVPAQSDGTETPARPDGNDGDDPLPAAVASWLDGVTGRVDDAERVASGDLATVARVAETRGGAAATAALAGRLAADERALRALAARAERLADRAAGVEVPAEALRRLS